MIIELATSLVFLATSVYGNATESPINNSETDSTVQPITLEEHVKEYFKDTPILAEIAKCESTYRHFGKDGKVIRGLANKSDVGVMQINEYYHQDRAKRLGYDLHTLEGNMAYAEWLYEHEGGKPWKASSKCWNEANNDLAIASKK